MKYYLCYYYGMLFLFHMLLWSSNGLVYFCFMNFYNTFGGIYFSLQTVRLLGQVARV